MTGTERRGPDEAYRLIVNGMMECFAHCRMLYDEQGRPDDFEHLEVNPAFARLTGIEDAAGRRATELLPTIRQETPELLQIFARVAETGEPAEFDIDFTPLGRWLHVSAVRPREGEFVAFFYDISEFKWAAGLARENEERLHRSLAAAGAGTWEWEVTTDENRWSDEIWALYDLDPAVHPASYEGWLASVRPEDRDGLESLLRDAVANGADLDFEWRVDTRDGSPRWLLSHGSAERDAEGTLVRYRGVVIDVTDRKRAVLEMLENEQRYAAIFEHSPIAISLTGMPDGRIVSANAAYCRLIEGPRDEIVGRTIVELGIATEDQWEDIVKELYSQGAIREQEIRRQKLGGEPMIVTVSLVRVLLGGKEHVLSMIRDITAQQQAEEAVEESRARLAAALASMTDGVYISGAEGDLVEINEAFARVNRFASKEECLRTFKEYPDLFEVFLDGAPAPLEMWAVSRALRGEARSDVEYGIRRKDTGEYWDASYSFAPIRGRDGAVVGSVFVERDISDRKRAERELTESVERFRSLFEHIPVAVFTTMPDGRVVSANPAGCRMFGCTEAEICAVGRGGLLDAADPRLAAALEERQRTGSVRGVVLTAIRKGGERFPVELDSVILPGEPAHSFVMMRDITERLAMEAALRESEAEARETVTRLSRAQRLGRMGDWEWDVATGAVHWSDEVYSIYGVDRGFTPTFDGIIAMLHAEDRDRDLAEAQELLDDPRRSSGDIRFRIVRPDDEVRHVYQTVVVDRDDEGHATRAYGVMQDVTELRETEEALVQSERSLRRIYDAGLVGVVYWTADGGITDANDRFLEMLGYTREELEAGEVGWAGVTPPEWNARDQESLDELRTTGRNAVPFAKEYFRKDGTRLPILTAAATLNDEGTRGIGLVLDISEQKRAEGELRRLNLELEDRVRRRTADLEAANAELEAFSYSVSHDLRAPLRHISGFATLLLEKLGEDDEEAGHFLDRITQSAADMSVLIDDLLQLSRVGRAEMHVEQVDMAALVDDVLEVLRSDLGERRVDVSVGEVLPVAGDRTLLRQVWANLLGNAFKYTRPRDPAIVEIGSRREGGQTVYWVRDNGVGFDMRYVDRLFRVFERLHRTEDFEGTGIGLANVARIVGRHDGRCWAESELGTGSRFYFALPRGK